MNFSKNLILFFSLLLILVGCGGHDDGSIPANEEVGLEQVKEKGDLISATFIDSAVEGLGFKGLSSNLTGFTKKDGKFSCEEGEDVEFSIGELILGKAVCRQLITPESMIDDKYLALKIGYVLIRLDYNANPDDGIYIAPAIREQSLYRGFLFDIIDDEFSVLENAISEITEFAPANSFYKKYGVSELTLEKVREHFGLSFVPNGNYQGVVTKLTINELEGQCELRSEVSARVSEEKVFFSGFAGLEKDDLNFSMDRTINSSKNRVQFKGSGELTGLYEKIVMSGKIAEGKLVANFKLGNIGSDGKLIPLCAGKLVLNKEDSIPEYYVTIRMMNNIASYVASAKSILLSSSVDSDIIGDASDLSNQYAAEIRRCIFKNNLTGENFHLCMDDKSEFDEKLNELLEKLINRRFSNPLFPEEPAKELKKAAKINKKLNAILLP